MRDCVVSVAFNSRINPQPIWQSNWDSLPQRLCHGGGWKEEEKEGWMIQAASNCGRENQTSLPFSTRTNVRGLDVKWRDLNSITLCQNRPCTMSALPIGCSKAEELFIKPEDSQKPIDTSKQGRPLTIICSELMMMLMVIVMVVVSNNLWLWLSLFPLLQGGPSC